MELDKAELSKLKELLDYGPHKIVIVSHTNPDGDAIGSSLAWGRWLEGKGHEVCCIVPNKYPYFLDWMPGIGRLGVFKEDKEGELAARIAEAGIIFCMDFNMVARLEGLGETILANKTAKTVLIDHHLEAPQGFDVYFSIPESSSTSYLAYKLIQELDGEDAITLEMGENLYVGMMTDTGNFSFSNLTADLFEVVASLVRKGLNIPRINSLVYNSYSVDRVRLLGYALTRMETLKAGATTVAYMALRESELRRFNFQQGDSEGFVNYPLTVKEISMSAMFIQTRNFIRVSFRSRGDVDVNQFARQYFEGGGHKNASGGKSFKSVPETIEYFRKCVAEFFSK